MVGLGWVRLVKNAVLYYPFGLRAYNFIFTIRKFVDTLCGFYEELKADLIMFAQPEHYPV